MSTVKGLRAGMMASILAGVALVAIGALSRLAAALACTRQRSSSQHLPPGSREGSC